MSIWVLFFKKFYLLFVVLIKFSWNFGFLKIIDVVNNLYVCIGKLYIKFECFNFLVFVYKVYLKKLSLCLFNVKF